MPLLQQIQRQRSARGPAIARLAMGLFVFMGFVSLNQLRSVTGRRADRDIPIAPATRESVEETLRAPSEDLLFPSYSQPPNTLNENKPFWQKRFPKGALLDFSEGPVGKGNRRQRTWLVQTGFKYPLLRFTEEYSTDTATGLESIHHTKGMVANHALVKLKPEVNSRDFLKQISRFGARIAHSLSEGVFLIQIPGSDLQINSLPALITRLTADRDGVAYAEPDHLVTSLSSPRPLTEPNDSFYSAQTELRTVRLNYGIGAPWGWSTRTAAPNVIVAVIDTGVNYTHEDLTTNMWTNPGEIPGNLIDDDDNGFVDDVYGYDFFNNDPDPNDDDRHGTHIAGIIGAEGNNGLGTTGVAWDVEIMAVKFLDTAGNGVQSDAIRAIQYATKNGATLLNNSWGGNTFSQSLNDSIADLAGSDILFVAAAGNDNQDGDTIPTYPAAFDLDPIISVGSLRSSGVRYATSNYGALSVDLFAPGYSIYSTLPGSNYGNLTGTSQSAPIVTGILALLRAEFPDESGPQLRTRLLATTYPLATLDGLCVTGGRADLDRAIRGLEAPSIEIQPQGASRLTGYPVTFQIGACGDGPLKYQWRKDDVNLPGATGLSLALESPMLSDAGVYSVEITNKVGSVVSDPAVLAVSELAPTFVSEPEDFQGVNGAAIEMSVSVYASLPISFQWLRNGTVVEGATNPSLLLTDLQNDDGGIYQVVVRNTAGVVSSREITVAYRGRSFDFWEDRHPYPLKVTGYQDVHFADGKFVAISSEGDILLSRKMGEWERVHGPTGHPLYDVTHDSGHWVAIGSHSQILVSRDGRFWEAKSDGLSAHIDYTFRYGASGNGRFVVAANYYTNRLGHVSIMAASGTNFNWVTGLPSNDSSLPIQFANGLFLAHSGSRLSTTGLDWTPSPTTLGHVTLNTVYPSDKFWMFSYADRANQSFRSSTNGIDWKEELRPSSITTPSNRAPFAVIGDQVYYDSRQLRLSDEESVYQPILSGFKSMAYGDGRYVSVCDDRIIESSDGRNFQSVSHRLSPPPADDDLVGIAYGSGLYVIMTAEQSVWTSHDGANWKYRTKTVPTHDTNQGLAYANARFLVVGNSGEVSLSEDGITWTNHTTNLPSTNSSRLSSAGNRFWIESRGPSSSDPKFYFTSQDGIQWTTSGVNHSNGVNYGNEQYFAMDDETYALSSDGLNWQEHPLPILTNARKSVTYADGGYLMVVGGLRKAYRSVDGIEWTEDDMSTIDANSSEKLARIGDVYLLQSYGLWISADGISWEKSLHGAVAFASSETDLVAIGPGQIIRQMFTGPRYQLTSATMGAGSVTTTPRALSYSPGTPVEAQAIPSPGMVFTDWSGAILDRGSTASLTLNSDLAIVAHFREFSPKWRSQNFLPEDIAAGLAEAWVDADNDGSSNYEEFLFASDPRSAFSLPEINVRWDEAPLNPLRVTFTRRTEVDLTYEFQVSLDLEDWSNANPEKLEILHIVGNGNGTESVTYHYHPDIQFKQKGFVRIFGRYR